ncbi:MAG TPA: Wzz/FepE/Etk N-terminal domain-containing protein [Leadbetterella sp.]|nr:Wzz/FepE/Etk N-terminal domain-containing protein [Leadbetterella sp.]
MESEYDELRINFKALWGIILKEKWLIIFITILFIVVGVIFAFSLKEEFKSEGKILPEIQAKGGSMGQFAGLAALAGVDLSSAGGGADAVRPDLYPDVLKSTPFFLRLFQEKIKNKTNKELSFQEFYNSEVLDGELKQKDQKNLFPKSDNYISFNRQTEKNIKDLKERIICTYDKKAGVISISVKMPDPVVAANVARFSMDYLTDYIINYRTEKQKRDLDFLAERLQAAKGKYFNNQSKKASYTDQMPLNALRLQTADLQRERIEAEYKTSSSFYNSLLQKYEEANLKIQQETPVIKVLEPPVVPNLKIQPNRVIIILISTLAGLLCGLFVSILIKKNYLKLFTN